MADLSKQYYELAFHISSNLEEADVQNTKQELERAITSNGGIISFAKELERIRLAYPIKHQTNAFFGYFNFNLELPEEPLDKIKDYLRSSQDVLRFLILKHEPEPKMDKKNLVRKMAAVERRKIKTVQQEKLSTKQEGPRADEGAIDQKLEEIIEQL
ncbi:MAG: 30S ribosomal protein S6 [Candidatus Yanofskybacteria bacterium RIFCSPHIGHO2_01_FULL_39_8b]|uniref:Small ribosomal subunit protein bS6 n=1 Tax=Candidatus Yanofskybacteria bacterium RIFCSPHIGHO2_01_FULL_39_8b TaxID=1802659 RepID=A0A1F8EA60_9BACT|nr:hypothetical protein [uncultured bacterium]OGM97229.1 MAG: 30S ribosomal protein S6 [Candidatus Yanofskybacteria bacterium RIFCSPHIGHO2_01_FULL_39_8b]